MITRIASKSILSRPLPSSSNASAYQFVYRESRWHDPVFKHKNGPVTRHFVWVSFKIWNGAAEANEPSEGWRSWCNVRDNTAWTMGKQAYVTYFRTLSYCFRDQERLAGWGRMFQEDWFVEERACARGATRSFSISCLPISAFEED
jgi:hypothetical protein